MNQRAKIWLKFPDMEPEQTVSGEGSSEYWVRRAKELNEPVAVGDGGCWSGDTAFLLWFFPDGHMEKLAASEKPRWPI